MKEKKIRYFAIPKEITTDEGRARELEYFNHQITNSPDSCLKVAGAFYMGSNREEWDVWLVSPEGKLMWKVE